MKVVLWLGLMVCVVFGQGGVFAQDAVPTFDTHLHLFDPEREEGIPWPRKNDEVLFHVTMPEQVLPIAKANNVQKIIVVQAGSWLMDNQWNLDVTKNHDDLFVGVVGNLTNIGTKAFAPMLDQLANDPRFVGIRISGRPKSRDFFSGTVWQDLKQLSDKKLVLDVLMNNPKSNFGLKDVQAIAAKNPELRVVMNHVAGYPIDGKAIDPEWATAMQGVAKHKHVYCKVSALLERSTIRPYSFKPEDYATILDFLYETFGEDRLMFGSDWPVTRYSGSYAQHKTIITDYFTQKGPAVLKKVMFENAEKFYLAK